MRKNGISLLRAFSDGPSLVSAQHASMLLALAEVEHSQPGVKGVLRSVVNGLGLSASRASEEMDARTIDNVAMCSTFGVQITDSSKPFAYSDGIAVIPVWGALLHRDRWCDEYATGYDYIRSKLSLAMGDPDVTGIVFDVNSYGGMVAGNFELCDEIYAARAQKPSLAVVDAMAYSGGFSVGSSASRMVATPSSGVGSIGVVMMHTSVEKMLEQMGLEVTFVFAGAHKVDGNPYEALPKDVKARWQKSVERSYEKFVSLVERNRGMSADAVRATEALCYDAEEAVEIGLIDAIQTPAEALAAFRQELYGSNTNPQQGATTMSNTATAATGGAGNAAADPATPATTVEAPAAAATAPAAAVEAPAATVAAPTDERARIKAITTCDEAKGRETLAAHFAFDTDMSVEAARAALSAAPAAAAPAASGSPFVAAMEGTANPEVGSLGAEGGETATISPGDRIANSYAAVTGKPVLPARK